MPRRDDFTAAGENVVVGFTEFEAYSDNSTESTTSNGWVTKSGYPYTTDVKTAGQYVIDWSAQLGQSDKQKEVGLLVEWREGTSGSWTELADLRDGVSQDDAWDIRTGFNLVTLSTDTEFQIRIRFGQTDEGGTGRIRFAGIKIGRVG
jgi:hypothetical protein